MSARRPAAVKPLRGRWLVALGIALGACAEAPSPSPSPSSPTEFVLPVLDFQAIATERKIRETAQAQLQRGLQCGWHATWMHTVRAARYDAPAAFRAQAVGSAFRWGGVLLALSLGGTLVLAWVLPRMRRRKANRARPAAGAVVPTWGSYFRGLAGRFFARVGRALRVEQFDPLLAGERQRMVEACRDAQRQLAVAQRAVTQLAAEGAPPPSVIIAPAADSPAASPAPDAAPAPDPGPPPGSRPASVASTIAAWRADLVSLQRRLEGPAGLPPELAPDRIAPRLAVIQRAARDTRLAAERALIGRNSGDATWGALERELADRPDTPRDHATSPNTTLAPWVRSAGITGVAAIVLGLPMLACWMAASAFPLFLALLFGLGGLGAVLLARVHLHRAGRLPLLPGLADRVARWLTAVIALTLFTTLVSSWMTTDGGLDLGDPPPVAMPDPKLLEGPSLFGDTSIKVQSLPAPSPPADTPAPVTPPAP